MLARVPVLLSSLALLTGAGCSKGDSLVATGKASAPAPAPGAAAPAPKKVKLSKLMTAKKWVYTFEDGFNVSGSGGAPKGDLAKDEKVTRTMAHHVKPYSGDAITVASSEATILAWIKERVTVKTITDGKSLPELVTKKIDYTADETVGTIQLTIRACREGDKYTDPKFDVRYDLQISERRSWRSWRKKE